MDEKAGQFAVNGRRIAEGEWITVDGGSGKVFAGQAALIAPELSGDFLRLMGWADRIRQLRVRVERRHAGRRPPGPGLRGRGHRPLPHRAHVLRRRAARRHARDDRGQDTQGRERALAKVLPMQRGDFEAIFRAMEGFPVTIRLLDPPLHEFLPKDRAEIEALAARAGDAPAELAGR